VIHKFEFRKEDAMSKPSIRRFLFPLLAGCALALTPLTLPYAAGQDETTGDEAAPLPTIELSPRTDLHKQRLAAVEEYLNSVLTLRARFIQQAPDGSMSRGIFHLERPGRVRFEFEEGVPILIVSDGRILNMIDYEMGQVTKWPIKDTPLALLVDEEIILGENVTLVSSGPGELANMISVTARNPKKPEQGTMTLIFSAEPAPGGGSPLMTLRAWQVIDAQGGLTTVTLAQPEINVALEASLWKFDDPRGDRFKRRGRRR
jgi:outer membrane lipoprotein-sorting protein